MMERRAFTIQLHDRIDPDECIGGDCCGPAPAAPIVVGAPMQVPCVACARRRLGLSQRRTSAWWRCEPLFRMERLDRHPGESDVEFRDRTKQMLGLSP